MENMTTYKFADIVLVPFPFTDQSTTRKRPAVIISSGEYNNGRPDCIIMAITSRLHQVNKLGEEILVDWQGAGLLKPSVFKPILTTVENTLILRKLGHLQSDDQCTLETIIQNILGSVLRVPA